MANDDQSALTQDEEDMILLTALAEFLRGEEKKLRDIAALAQDRGAAAALDAVAGVHAKWSEAVERALQRLDKARGGQ